MPAPRFRSRFTHATIYDYVRLTLADAGWTTGSINFDTKPVKVIDYQPDERGERINVNTVAVTLGDVPADMDEELGAADGGLRSVAYPVYLDVYMEETSLTIALCDDLKDAFTDLSLQLEDKIGGGFVPDVILTLEDVVGPERPPSSSQSQDGFKRSWRVIRFSAVLYFNT